MKPKVLIYAPDNEELVEAIRALASAWQVKNFDTLGGLLARAAQPLASQDAVLLLKINNYAAMETLIRFLAGSLDFEIILLIEPDDFGLAQTALTARPRMVFNGRPSPETVAAVLDKMRPRIAERAAMLSG